MKFLIESSSPAQIFALQALIHSQPGWQVVGSLRTPGEIPAAAGRTRPDVIILDLDGVEGAGEVINALCTAAYKTELIFLGSDAGMRQQVDSAGAGHFFNKAYSPESLLAVLTGCETKKIETTPGGFRLA